MDNISFGLVGPKKYRERQGNIVIRTIKYFFFKGTVSLCNKLISEKKSVKNYNIHGNCYLIWLYLSRNKMIGIPEIGKQCEALIDAMLIETM